VNCKTSAAAAAATSYKEHTTVFRPIV